MTGMSPEQQANDLAQQATASLFESMNALHELQEKIPRGTPETLPEADSLKDMITGFVTTHPDAWERVGDLDRPPELTESIEMWTRASVRKMMLSAMFTKRLERAKFAVDELLEGRILRATGREVRDVNGGVRLQTFGTRHGYGGTSYRPRTDPTVVEGPYMSCEPYSGLVWIGTRAEHHLVSLWSPLDRETAVANLEVVPFNVTG
jgi:hypothetical protein